MNKLNQRISGLILMIVGIGILWVAYAETQPKGVELLRRGRPWHLAVIFLLIFGLELLSLVLKKRNTQTVDSSISKRLTEKEGG